MKASENMQFIKHEHQTKQMSEQRFAGGHTEVDGGRSPYILYNKLQTNKFAGGHIEGDGGRSPFIS